MGIVDLSYLENMTSGDKDIMTEMLDLLIEETPKHLKNMESFLAQSNWGKLSAEAHKIKPMLLYVGLTELNEITKEIELYGKNQQNLETIPELVEKLILGFSNVEDELKQKKAELA